MNFKSVFKNSLVVLIILSFGLLPGFHVSAQEHQAAGVATVEAEILQSSNATTDDQNLDQQEKVNGVPAEISPDQAAWYEKYKTQTNVPEPSAMLLNSDPEPTLADGFTDLFNGRDLAGWTPKGGTCKFEAVAGQIQGTCVRGSASTYLCTDKSDYQDFIFTCDFKWSVDGNTGVMFRAKTRPNPNTDVQTDANTVVFGPQLELEGFDGFSKGRGWSGGIYGQDCGGYFYPLWLKRHAAARAALREGEWNRCTISAIGNVVKTWLNGVPVTHWIDDGSYPEGYFGLQVHAADEGTILFRNLRVKELNK